MSGIAFFNQARSPLAVAVAGSDLTIQLVSGGPWAGATGPFTVIIENEAIRCSSINGNTLQVAANGRGFDQTSPQAHALTDTLGNPTMVVGAIVRRDLQDAFVRLDTAAAQTLTGPLSVPPTLGAAPAAGPGGYGTLPTLIDYQSVTAVASIVVPPTGVLPTGLRTLKIKWKLKTNSGVVAEQLSLRFNGSSALNYWDEYIQVLNAALTGVEENTSLVAGGAVGLVPGTTAPANSFGSGEITIYDYTSPTDHKTYSFIGGTRRGAGASGGQVIMGMGGWVIAPVAVTTVTLVATGNLTGQVWTSAEP